MISFQVFSVQNKEKVDEGNQRAENECFSQNTVIDGIKIKDLEFKKYTYNNILGMVKLLTDDYLYNYNDIYVLLKCHYVYHME